MPFLVSSALHTHPAAQGAGSAALGLWVRAGTWASRHKTDGLIPWAVLRSLGAHKRLVDQLLDLELFTRDGAEYALGFADVLWLKNRPTKTQRRWIPTKLRIAVYARDGFKCLYCGANEDLTLDHVWPYSLGGEDTLTNLQTLCRSCNASKGTRT